MGGHNQKKIPIPTNRLEDQPVRFDYDVALGVSLKGFSEYGVRREFHIPTDKRKRGGK
jgi:hypothetical protein